MTEPASPLGRYVLDGDGEPVEVRLLRTPLELLVSSREHHDGLMREFRLLALSGRVASHGAPARLVELTEVLGRQFGTASRRRDEEVDRALERGEQVHDLVYVVPRSVVESVGRLEALMAEADTFCAAEQLLTLERPPLLREFASWYLDQFVAQSAGQAPTPWAGPTTLPEP